MEFTHWQLILPVIILKLVRDFGIVAKTDAIAAIIIPALKKLEKLFTFNTKCI